MRSYCKGLLFDNDGVLVDSMAGAIKSWSIWAEKFSPGFELLPSHHGQTAESIARNNLKSGSYEEAFQYILDLEVELAVDTIALEGAIELTSSLQAGSWTIVTSASPKLAHARLNAAGIPIPKELVTSTDVTHGKPNPEPYLLGATRLGLDISDCVVFEDAASGIQAGLDAGAGLLVGVTEHAMDTKADLVVKSLKGIRFNDGELIIPDEIRLR
ncbi:MAG: HAD-IA family hydrolase [Aquiluna sp.]|nr:HAD-IA family hydrolase [Aquiluna sp.]MCF8545495.1 HAD-IA family hydrolase [Aquiluna sp.]